MNPERILIIQTAFLGDVILCTPLIKGVRKKYPESKIFFLVIPQTRELLQNNPYLDEIIVYDKKGKEKSILRYLDLVKRIKAKNFDWAFIPHRSLRSTLLAYLAGIPQRVGFNKSAGSFLFTKKIKYIQNQPETERNLSLLETKSSSENDFLPELFPSDDDFRYVEDLFKSWNIKEDDKVVGIAPGSVWETKKWIPDRFGQVADFLMERFKVKVIFLGGKEDESLSLEISKDMRNKSFIATGKTTSLQSAAMISRCKVILSNDTAPMHMAVGMKTPVVAIFGSTIPEFGFAPTGKNDVVIQKEVYCRPCGIHGRRKCPEKHFRCMKEITVEEVLESVAHRL
jgi:heptosyltransferase-2